MKSRTARETYFTVAIYKLSQDAMDKMVK